MCPTTGGSAHWSASSCIWWLSLPSWLPRSAPSRSGSALRSAEVSLMTKKTSRGSPCPCGRSIYAPLLPISSGRAHLPREASQIGRLR